jgi:hypothetical protein
MKQTLLSLFLLVTLAGCSLLSPAATAAPLPTQTTVPPTAFQPVENTFTPVPPSATPLPPTETPTATPTPQQSYGPTGFPSDVNPLTGLRVADASLLNRRPVIIKIQNLPRDSRPQWGLSSADLVFEYYTEFGTTRFAAVYYGENTPQAGPIRSARFIDVNFIRGYKAFFVFGSAYEGVYSRLINSEFSNRLILEQPNSCPPLCRVEPTGHNYLVADTGKMNEYLASRRLDNSRQNLDGMLFDQLPPQGGSPASTVYARFSSAIFNRWDYDPASGTYLRFSDTQNDTTGQNEVYAPLLDRNTGEQIRAENVVVLFVEHNWVVRDGISEVVDMTVLGQGNAYIARDGQIYNDRWQRLRGEDILTLVDAEGKPFPFKPGQTWFEIIAQFSAAQVTDTGMRFINVMP